MYKFVKSIAIALVVFVGLSSFSPAPISVKPWKHIETKKVNYRVDRDVIHLGINEGRFSKLKLKVTGGDINMHRMVVHYANGKPDEISLRHTFNKRSSSRIIDLNGNKRYIKKIVLVYDTQSNENRKARMSVFGKR